MSSITVSLVRKSAPIVALYWVEKRLLTYWFIRDVFPTLKSASNSSSSSSSSRCCQVTSRGIRDRRRGTAVAVGISG